MKTKINEINKVLNNNVTEIELIYLAEDWKAFVENPTKYADSVIVDMVNQYLSDMRKEEEEERYYREHCGAYYVMYEDINCDY